MPFHLTARVQGRESLFREIEPAIQRLIHEATRMSDATILAYAIMPNHLHLVIVQGTKQLCYFMQPLLRRIALLVQRRHRREGHIFERRYNAVMCRDPEYLRNAIIYVHLNPVRAGLCDDPTGYEWTSHREYIAAAATPELASKPVVESALRLFSRVRGCSIAESCRDYNAFLAWRIALDRFVAAGGILPVRPTVGRPCTDGGDGHWFEVYGACSDSEAMIGGYALDLRDIALRVLSMIAPQMDLDYLRSGSCDRGLVKVRREVVVRARDAGYRPVQIARFLGISTSAVSAATRPH